MKYFSNKFVIATIFFLSFSLAVFSQSRKQKKADEDTMAWNYEIECSGVGLQGTYLVKVWSYSKQPKVAIEQAKKNAVHGIIFKGFVGNSGKGCPTQKPMSNNVSLQEENGSFFNSFFAEGGRYKKFVTLSTDGALGAGDIMKVRKGLYKVGVIVSVQKDELRKDLEDAGVVKGLSSGF